MLRRLLLLSLLTLAATAAHAQLCNLAITVNCTPTQCDATTVNNGTNVCTGDFLTGFFAGVPPTQVQFSNFTSTIDTEDCFDSSSTIFGGGQEAFVFCFGQSALHPGQSFTAHANIQTFSGAPSPLPVIGLTAVFDDLTDEQLAFVYAFNDVATPTCTPTATVASIGQSNVPYDVVWTTVQNQQTQYQVDESTTADFSANVTTRTVSGTSATYQHVVSTNTTYYYRVRATACSTQPGPNSATVSIVVQAPPPPTTAGNNTRGVDNVLPFGTTTPFSFSLFIPPPAAKSKGSPQPQDVTFATSVDKAYLTVSPSSGTIGPNGTTVTVTTSPGGLPPGANTGTVSVTGSSGMSLASVPVSVSLVTPVSSNPKSLPPGNSLIIPIVTHVNSGSGPFQSDVRLTNAGGTTIKYQVSYTPSRTDGTKTTKSTQISVDGGQTIALNDIVKDFFGVGATGDANDSGAGSLEIRPLNTSSTLTYASSRTFVTQGNGTLGQFIAAVPFTKFATNFSMLPIGGGAPPASVLQLQQIAQSSKFRTNLGIVEGSGSPANGQIRIYDDAGTLLKSVPYNLMPGEHQQLNTFLSNNGITLNDGRIEITVDSTTGAVSAYASVLDQITADPLAVQPAQPSQISATRYVIPGMADVQGITNFHSDVRVFNGGPTAVTVTPTYFQRNDGPVIAATPITIGAGQVKAIDEVVPTLFNAGGTAGQIAFTTATPSSLVVTGRTYTITDKGGTFGQFIPGVTPSEGIGVGNRPLQLLQLEQSQNFRTNVGLAELTGNEAHVRITMSLPDSKASAVYEDTLHPNEFKQIPVLSLLNPGNNSYNARLSIEVTSGAGRITAYGSVIDNITQDPTYVPAQ